jgi:hypothetical protein
LSTAATSVFALESLFAIGPVVAALPSSAERICRADDMSSVIAENDAQRDRSYRDS